MGDGVEHAVESGAGDAEDFGGAELIAVAGEEDGLDLLADDLIEADESGLGWMRCGRGAGEGGEGGVEVGGGEGGGGVFEEVAEGGMEVVEVAGPRLGGGGGEEGGVERGCGEVEGCGEVVEEEVNEVRDVVVTLAEGWNFDLESSEGVGEIWREGAGTDEGAETAFGEGDEARSLGAAFAKKAEEGGLGGAGEAVGLGEVEHAFVEGGRGGIGGEALFGVGGAEGEKRAIGERREAVQGSGDGFVAGADFPGEQGGAEVGCYTLDSGPKDRHGGAWPEQRLRSCEDTRGGQRGLICEE